MYKIVNLCEKDLNAMCDLWNSEREKDGFYALFTHEEFKNRYLGNEDFSFDGVYGAFDGDSLVAYGIALLRKLFDGKEYGGYIHMILVKEEYRKKGLGSALLSKLEEYLKLHGKKSASASYYLPLCFEWYIPKTDHHNHPCAPGIRINSSEYFFLLHRGYEIAGQEDAFHLDLCNYEISPAIKKILDENKKDGITIELYDKNKHFGLDEFYKDLNIYDFEKVIRANLELEKPYPFLVVSDNGKIVGWTGALWNEPSGRGHFDGIAILERVRGRGLGKALFSLLAYHSKLNGAKFMTFYTGLTNHARYIYMKAGFKIEQSYALMRKKEL